MAIFVVFSQGFAPIPLLVNMQTFSNEACRVRVFYKCGDAGAGDILDPVGDVVESYDPGAGTLTFKCSIDIKVKTTRQDIW